jgi:hypothetical protein
LKKREPKLEQPSQAAGATTSGATIFGVQSKSKEGHRRHELWRACFCSVRQTVAIGTRYAKNSVGIVLQVFTTQKTSA